MRGLWQFMKDVFGLTLGSSGLVHVGTFTVRQSGGVAGSNEVQISNDGSNGRIACQNQLVVGGINDANGGVMVRNSSAVTSVALIGGPSNFVSLGSASVVAWGNSVGAPTSGGDLILARDAANTLAQRNGTAAQVFNIYNTFTDASNYEAAYVGWSGNTFFITPTKAGTGVNRIIQIGGSGASNIYFNTVGNVRWLIDGSGHILGNGDNTFDIGASGANRPRTGYFGTSVVTATVASPSGSDLNLRPPASRALSLGAANGGAWLITADKYLAAEGNFNLWVGTSALATTATAGFLGVNSCAGTPTGVPTSIPTGQIPMVYDTSAHKIWFYSGSWRGVAVT